MSFWMRGEVGRKIGDKWNLLSDSGELFIDKKSLVELCSVILNVIGVILNLFIMIGWIFEDVKFNIFWELFFWLLCDLDE